MQSLAAVPRHTAGAPTGARCDLTGPELPQRQFRGNRPNSPTLNVGVGVGSEQSRETPAGCDQILVGDSIKWTIESRANTA
jgi:hypothetical protein